MTKQKIVAIGLSYNEADVVRECVKDALEWVDEFILYDNSTDGTANIAEKAGAIVLRGPEGESFSEHMRQHCLDYINENIQDVDWVVRIDPDEFYPRGVWMKNGPDSYPRRHLENTQDNAVRAHVIQFWITQDDVRRGLILENDRVSVRKRRRWYSVGHSAVVAWRHDPALCYPVIGMRNVPAHPDPSKAIQAGPPSIIQTHYTCRSWPQLWDRIQHREKFRKSFGKYVMNLVIDDDVLYYWHGGPFINVRNHELLYEWYETAQRLYEGREL